MLRALRRPIRIAQLSVAAVAVVAVSTLAPDVDAAGSGWVREMGTSTDDFAEVVGSNAGGVYVAGEVSSALPGQVHAGQDDVFLQRYGPAGGLVWTRQFGSTQGDYVRAIVVRKNAIYLLGSTFGTLPGQASSGDLDAWIRRYNTAGDVVWTVQFGTAAYDTARGLDVDKTGIWVTGSTDGVFPGQTPGGETDAYIRRFGPGGGAELTRQFGSASDDGGSGIAVAGRRVHVIGYSTGALPGKTSFGASDAFLRIYRLGGKVVRTRQFGTSGSDSALEVIAGLGGVYVAGDTNGAMTPSAAGGFDVFLRKFDANGRAVWLRQFGSPVDDAPEGLAIAGGEIHLAGPTDGAFPGKTLKGAGDVFVQSYSRKGDPAGTRQFGTGGEDEAYGLSASSTGLYVAGGTDGTFPGQTNAGMWDGFLRRFPTP